MNVGDVLDSNNFGKFEVVEVLGKNLKIKFLNTGNVKIVQRKVVKAGGVLDSYEALPFGVGQLYNTSNCGLIRVVKIVKTKKVIVEFVNTGNIV